MIGQWKPIGSYKVLSASLRSFSLKKVFVFLTFTFYLITVGRALEARNMSERQNVCQVTMYNIKLDVVQERKKHFKFNA